MLYCTHFCLVVACFLLTLVFVHGQLNPENRCDHDCGAYGECIEIGDIPDCEVTDSNPCQEYRCVCDYGWTGKDCSLEYVTCAEKITTSPDPNAKQCFNGGRCETYTLDKVEEDETALVGTRCNCQSLPTDTIAYAGHQCEFAAEQVCVRDVDHSTFAFCVNNGTCVEFIDYDDADHPLCDCPRGYGGRHCQYKLQDLDGDGNFDPAPKDEITYVNIITKGNETLTIQPTSQSNELSGGKKFLVILVVFLICSLLCCCCYSAAKRRRSQKNSVTNPEKDCTTSRTDDTDREIL